MSERYQRWLQIFKQLNEHSPSKEEIELIAPSHIREEYLKLHPSKKIISKPTFKVKLKRSFDEKDCLPEPVLKKHRVNIMPSEESVLQTKNLPSLRRSPRKHPSSTLACSTTYRKISTPFKSARRSLNNILETDFLQNTEPSASFIIPGGKSPADIAQLRPNEKVIRRSPRKHPSSCNEILLSPQKPSLLSRPIVCRRLSSLLGSIGDVENENKSARITSLESAVKDEISKTPEGDLQESNNILAEEELQAFPCGKDHLKRKTKGKNDNYRRLKMKKSYVRGTSSAKKHFRKWRKTRNKR